MTSPGSEGDVWLVSAWQADASSMTSLLAGQPGGGVGYILEVPHATGCRSAPSLTTRFVKHVGIYIGDGLVVHFGRRWSAAEPLAQMQVTCSTAQQFMDGQPCRFNLSHDVQHTAFPPALIKQRAVNGVNGQRGEYSVWRDNCEHFAYRCRYGRRLSPQVEQYTKNPFTCNIS